MARTKVTARRQAGDAIANFGPKIFVPRPTTGPNIRLLRAGGQPWRKRTKSTAKQRTTRAKFKIKKLLDEPKTVQIKKDGQVVQTITANRKSYYFDGTETKRYNHRCFIVNFVKRFSNFHQCSYY